MAQGEFWVERQNWARWPRTLMMHHVSGEVRRYVPAWSDRPNEMCRDVAIEGEWFECSKCGIVVPLIHPDFCPRCGRKVV